MDFEDLGLTELIRLQSRISELLTRKFERSLAIAFSDVVGSSSYTARHGDEAGRVLQQRHLDVVVPTVAAHRGRIVDTAGDGAFCVFDGVTDAVHALADLQRGVQARNTTLAPDHHLAVRTAAHFGKALTDGQVVSGDAVNFCARVAASAIAGEVRLTRGAFHELGSAERARCRALPLVSLKDFGEGIPVFAYEWRELARFPVALKVEETGAELLLPDKEVVTIGRLRNNPNGTPANDLVIVLPDADRAVLVSRWHLEVRRRPDGLVVRSVSDRATELNGATLPKGVDAEVRAGDVVRLAGVVTLTFLGESLSSSALSTRGGA